MIVAAFLKSLKPGEIWKLFDLFGLRPRYAWSAFNATRETIALARTHFGKRHRKNYPANAFRHALWNVLIAKKIVAMGKPVEEAVFWAKKITDWHEDFSPNSPLERAMDFHNNEVGRVLFSNNPESPTSSLVDQLLNMTQNSKLITQMEELKHNQNNLVHLIAPQQETNRQ